MPDNVCTQIHETGDVSVRATANVTGGRFVAPSATRTGGGTLGLSTDTANIYGVAHAGAGAKAVGVAKYDIASGDEGGIHGRPGKIVPVTSGAAVTAGQEVQSDANGKAITLAAGRPNGLALTTVGAADLPVEVKLY
jgi:hypothetical protein